MDLFNLSKDMLVKLVSEIREDAIKENDEKNRNKYNNLIHKLTPGKTEIISCYCCNVFVIVLYHENRTNEIIYKSDNWIEDLNDFKGCSNNNYGCDVYYCKKHFEELTAFEAGTYHLNEGWLCSLCNPWK